MELAQTCTFSDRYSSQFIVLLLLEYATHTSQTCTLLLHFMYANSQNIYCQFESVNSQNQLHTVRYLSFMQQYSD